MGGCVSCAALIRPSDLRRYRKLTRAERQIVNKYLSDFRYYDTPTLRHRKLAADFWAEAFFESGPSARSTTRKSANSQAPSRLTQLYDVFYNYLDHNAPTLRHVFRSSMHVRSKVLVHISAGMRTLLESPNIEEEVVPLVRTHVRYGVKLEYHNPLGNALMYSMKEVAGPLWTPEVDDAWRRLFSYCCVILLLEHKKAETSNKTNDSGYGSPLGMSQPQDSPRRPTSIRERFSSERSGREERESYRSASRAPQSPKSPSPVKTLVGGLIGSPGKLLGGSAVVKPAEGPTLEAIVPRL